jgi:hypothetical protein
MDELGKQLIALYNSGDMGDDEVGDLNAAVDLLCDVARATKNEEFMKVVNKLSVAVQVLLEDVQQ